MKEHALSRPLVAPSRNGWTAVELGRFISDRFLLLPLGALIALVWANTASESYFIFSHALSFWVNEIAMAVFLALIAQEILEALMPGGALHSWRRWSVPVIAAGGGIAGSAGVFLAYVHLKYEPVLAVAWPVACAVDVAAAYYVVKAIAPRSSAVPFVLIVAAVTDAFGLLMVGLRPSSAGVHPGAWLLIVALVCAAALLRARRVTSFWPYLVGLGLPMWWAFYRAGLHPALALVPIVPFLPRQPRAREVFAEPADDTAVHHFEHEWNHVVQIVLFLFGLVNAGVILRGYGTGTWAILTAALVGRPLGIVLAVACARAGGLPMPPGLRWPHVVTLALATSSGFTFALFFATSVLPPGPTIAEIKIGALASVAGAALAFGAARRWRIGRMARAAALSR